MDLHATVPSHYWDSPTINMILHHLVILDPLVQNIYYRTDDIKPLTFHSRKAAENQDEANRCCHKENKEKAECEQLLSFLWEKGVNTCHNGMWQKEKQDKLLTNAVMKEQKQNWPNKWKEDMTYFWHTYRKELRQRSWYEASILEKPISQIFC